MLKIAIVTNNYTPYCGGVVSSIDSFVSQLRIIGHRVFIITLDFENQNTNGQELDVIRIECPIKFKYKNNPMAIPWMPDIAILNIIEEIEPDIIHTQHPFLLGVSALKASKKLKIPIVFTFHTHYEQYLHYIPLPELLTKPVVNNFAFNYCNQVDGIISPSYSTYKFLKNNRVDNNIQIIPSGILPVFFPSEFNQKEIKNKFNLLTVSRFVKEKNIEFLFDVFAQLDQDKFIFTLIGYGADLPNLKFYAYEKLKLSPEKVIFTEKPEKEIIASHYKNSDLFIFSSVTETQGLVLAEAMANGTPVVAMEATGSSDIIKNNQNGFLINSVNEMASIITKISEDKNLHNQLQKNAWATAQDYSQTNTTNKLIEFYYSFLYR